MSPKIIKTLVSCLLLTGYTLTAQAATEKVARPLTQTSLSTIANTYQQYGLNGTYAGGTTLAPLSMSAKGFGSGRLSSKGVATPFQPLPALSVSASMTIPQVQEYARTWFLTSFPSYQARYAQWLKSNNLAMGIYNFTQDVNLKTAQGVKKKSVAFNAVIYADGRATYGMPKVVDPDIVILDAKYVSLRTASELPATWTYKDGGKLMYRLLNSKYDEIAPWSVIDVNGGFDVPEEEGSPEQMANCIADRRYEGCPQGLPDMKGIFDSVGATFGMLTYVNSIEPVYDPVPGSEDEVVPQMGVEISKRYLSCSAYVNEGYFGYNVQMTAQQYLVEPIPGLTKVSQIGSKEQIATSNTEPFQKSVQKSALAGIAPESVFINPQPGNDALMSVYDPTAKGLVTSIAPVTRTGNESGLSASSFSGNIPVTMSTSATGGKQFVIGWAGQDYLEPIEHAWSTKFTLASLSGIESFTLSEVNFDDFLNIKVNGNTVYNGPYGGRGLIFDSNPQMRWDCAQDFGNSIDTWNCKGERFRSCALAWDYSSVSWAGYYWCYKQPICENWLQVLIDWKDSDVYGVCHNIEQGRTWTFNKVNTPTLFPIDIKKFLREGENTIDFKVVVGGKGDVLTRFDVTDCGP